MDVADDALELRRTSTLSTLVAQRLEALILGGRLPPGERLNEVALARELGVSRGPIREAARLLSNHGLVEFIANKGAFVRQIDRGEMLEIYDLRAVLTGHACELAAMRATPAETQALSDLLERMDAATATNDAAGYYGLNLDFHALLMETAKSTRLRSYTEGLNKEAHLYRQVSLQTLPDMEQSNRDHAAIVAAIRAGEAQNARELGEAHVRAGKARFEAAVADALFKDRS
ncbi:GntR family transcriptional regulator [Arenibaculum sp.]|jgi:DNA-binding GntR family transcriptional regulator|uniref:GntR family transcriptional regulator n=1 Tax=Arenibaculum sp. TaxID=2865862 RepID=UPI002E0D1700|nr:FCD domain-containing protein [Arenibaculum sp.]